MNRVRMTQVTALIIHAVGAGHRYGFDVMDATGLASGIVYPALSRLEDAAEKLSSARAFLLATPPAREA